MVDVQMDVANRQETNLGGSECILGNEAFQEWHDKHVLVLLLTIVELEEEIRQYFAFILVCLIYQTTYRLNYMIGAFGMFIRHSQDT